MASVPSKSDIREAAGKVVGGAHDLARSTGAHLDSAGDGLGDLYARGADSAREALSEMPAGLSDVAAAGERFALRGRQVLDHGVRRQPVEALLLAGAIGYLVGWAVSRG